MEIPITINSDEKGYFDRECPNEECLYQFKIKLSDWEEKVSDEKVYCPMCGHVATSDKWWTQDQLESMEEIVSSYALGIIQEELDKGFKALERKTRNNKGFKIKYKPGKRVTFINNPIGQMPEWETEIHCSKCGTSYSVIGTAYFCPCCGSNNTKKALRDSLKSIEKMIGSLDDVERLFIGMEGEDAAKDMKRSLLEDSLGNVVSAFQKYASLIYEEISGNTARVNDFQIVDKGSSLYKGVCGKDYSDILSCDELERMKLLFQKRHILEHNAGIVDEKYINKSGDTNYVIGQRIVVNRREVYELLNIIKKLCDGLEQLCT